MRYLVICVMMPLLMSIFWGCASRRTDVTEPSSYESSAQSPSEKLLPRIEIASLSLNEAVRLVVQYNPELKAVEKEIDAASARIIQAKLLTNPTLFMETEDGRANLFGFGGEYKVVFGISQPIPLGGKIKSRADVAQKEKEIAMVNYEQTIREIIAQSKKVFVRIVTSQQLVNNALTNLEIARKLFESTKARVEVNAAPETEQIKAQIELSQAEVNLVNTQTELVHVKKQLNVFLENIDIKIKDYTGAIRETFPPLTDPLLPESEKSLSLISDGYQQGKFTYIELLDAQRTLFETRQTYLGLLEGLNNSVIEIERLTGKSIDDLKGSFAK